MNIKRPQFGKYKLKKTGEVRTKKNDELKLMWYTEVFLRFPILKVSMASQKKKITSKGGVCRRNKRQF